MQVLNQNHDWSLILQAGPCFEDFHTRTEALGRRAPELPGELEGSVGSKLFGLRVRYLDLGRELAQDVPDERRLSQPGLPLHPHHPGSSRTHIVEGAGDDLALRTPPDQLACRSRPLDRGHPQTVAVSNGSRRFRYREAVPSACRSSRLRTGARHRRMGHSQPLVRHPGDVGDQIWGKSVEMLVVIPAGDE